MSSTATGNLTSSDVGHHELKHLRDQWWCLLILGILLIVGGTAAIFSPFFATLIMVAILGAVLIICGLAMVITSFWTGKWSAFLLQLLVGILYVVAGIAINDKPLEAIEVLTLFIAAFMLLVGSFRAVAALMIRFPQWGWALLNGVVTFLCGAIIYNGLPLTATWVIGLLVGLELLLNGWSWLMLSLVIRKLPKSV